MTDWQPIETAPPKTAVLVWAPETFAGCTVAWLEADGAWTREGDDYNLVVEPTHWMPLPAPPQP